MPGQDVSGISPLPKSIVDMDVGEEAKRIEQEEEERREELFKEVQANLRQELERVGLIEEVKETKDEGV